MIKSWHSNLVKLHSRERIRGFALGFAALEKRRRDFAAAEKRKNKTKKENESRPHRRRDAAATV